MTLRTGSLRIDPVAVARDGERVVTVEQIGDRREARQPLVAGPVPGVAQHDDGRRRRPARRGNELLPEALDARVALVVEEVEVVDESAWAGGGARFKSA